MKKIIICLLAFILLVFNTNVYALSNNTLGKTSMYIWNISNIDYKVLDKTVNYLNIDTLYIGNYSNLNDDNHKLLYDYCLKNNIKSYLIYGEKEASIKDIKKLIDKTNEYNNTHTYKISGLVIDSEFHSTDEYRSANQEERIVMFRKYVDTMKEAYTYAKGYGLKYLACIPVSYDSISEDLLEELISDGCDYIQVMNYNKSGMLSKIDKEVELSKKYNKVIENIGEFLEPGVHDVTDKITFYNDGIDSGTKKFIEIKDHYKYSNMKFCYHAYSSISKLIENVKVEEPTTTTTTKKVTTTTTTKSTSTTTTSTTTSTTKVLTTNTTKKIENEKIEEVVVPPTSKDNYIIIVGIIGIMISSLYLIYQLKNN